MTVQVIQQMQIDNRHTTAWPDTPKPDNGLPKIAICIPFNGNWLPEWVEKQYLPLMYQPTNWCQKIAFLTRVPSISVARNTLVEQALSINADYILFVDSDIVMESPSDPNVALSQLYQIMNKSTNKDDKYYKSGRIVSAIYRAKQKTGFSMAAWMKYQDKGFTPIANWKGNLLTVDVVGMGFCLIDLKIFKEIPKPWFVWNEPNGISEDFYFCMLAKQHGYDIHVYSDIKLSHLGMLKVKYDGTITVPDV
jgi:glycosyltransferase involved in cell wall biosynthesis